MEGHAKKTAELMEKQLAEIFRINRKDKIIALFSYLFLPLGCFLAVNYSSVYDSPLGKLFRIVFTVLFPIWIVWALYKVLKEFRFSVALYGDSIRVGKIERRWSDIADVEFWQIADDNPGIIYDVLDYCIGGAKRSPAIILYDSAGEKIEIPHNIENVSKLTEAVRANVKALDN